jgi:hypothetical protein
MQVSGKLSEIPGIHKLAKMNFQLFFFVYDITANIFIQLAFTGVKTYQNEGKNESIFDRCEIKIS